MASESTGSTGSVKIQWPHHSSVGFFRRYDGAYRDYHIALGNHAIQRVFERHFEYMSRNLYFISAFGRIILGIDKEAEVIKAEDAVERFITKASDAIDKRIGQLELIMAEACLEDDVKYGKKEMAVAPITSPGARKYAVMLEKADRFFSLNANIWMEGLIDNKTKFANEGEIRKEITRVVQQVAAHFQIVLQQTREKDAALAAKAGEHNERQLEREAVDAVSKSGEDAMAGSVSSSSADETPAQTKTSKAKATAKAAEASTATAAE